jgi:hypothetical protein
MTRFSGWFAVFAVGSLSLCDGALSQEIVGGDKAKRFFEQFKNEDREKLTDPFESITRESDDDKGTWTYSPSKSSPVYHIAPHKPGALSVGVDDQGRRYIEQDGTGVDVTGVGGWSLGMWLKAPGKNPQHSDLSPAALHANRVSYLVRLPEEVVLADGTIVDVKKDPLKYLETVGFQRGTYNQHDGWGWTDYSQEDSGWHFYYWPAWMKRGQNTVKVEPLVNDPRYGPNFLRVTFNTQHATIRSGSIHSRGQFSATDPELATYEGDTGSILRTETRYYFMPGNRGEPRLSDPDESTPNPFDDGKRLLHLYGSTYWYEDDQVNIATFTKDKPGGASVAQEIMSLDALKPIDFSVEIRNTGDTPAEYIPSVAMLHDSTLILNLSGDNKAGLTLYADSDRNGALDANEATQKVTSSKIKVAARDSGRYILRFDPTKLDPAPSQILEKLGDNRDPRLVVIDINLTVNTVDPKDPMSLKGASVHFLVGLTDTKAALEKLEKRNLYLTGGSNIRYRQFNRAPEAKLRVSKVVGKSLIPLQSGAEITVGDTIRLESFGSHVDGEPKEVAHRFYFPDGTSAVRKNGDEAEYVDYRPWQAGRNNFLLHVADGYSRAFEEFSLNVKQATNVAPQVAIDHPKEGVVYPAKFKVFFGAKVGPTETHDPDGGKQGTKRGITKFEWDFGDGTSVVTDQFPEHAFSKAGTYTVRLTVTDDEGSRSTVNRKVTIRVENQAPQAKVEAVSPESFMAFGLVEVTAAGTTDADQSETNNEGLKFSWSVRGPNGLTDKQLSNFTEKTPRYLFVAPLEGRYTVSVTARDKGGAKSTSQVSFDVKPWDGVARVNMFANQPNPGSSYGRNDIDPEIPKGWSIGHAGQARSVIGFFGKTIVEGRVEGSKGQIRNNDPLDMPAGASPLQTGLFSSAIETVYSERLYTFYNLPPGTYEVTAYLYDQERKAPGTEYGIRFKALDHKKAPIQLAELKTKIPKNPKASDFIVKGRIVVPPLGVKGSVVITGRTPAPKESKITETTVLDSMRSPLAAFELRRIDGPPAPPTPAIGAPRNLTVTSK